MKKPIIMDNTKISDTLLFKFFLGETTNDETDRIAAWLDADPEEHQKYMNEVHEKFIVSIMIEPDSVPEADTSLWYRITHSRAIRQTMGIAAFPK